MRITQFCQGKKNINFKSLLNISFEVSNVTLLPPSFDIILIMHCVKNVRIRSCSGPYFPVYGHFLRSDGLHGL